MAAKTSAPRELCASSLQSSAQGRRQAQTKAERSEA
jgi:hypothetical protein